MKNLSTKVTLLTLMLTNLIISANSSGQLIPAPPPPSLIEVPAPIKSLLAIETMGNTLFNLRLEDREGASQYQNLGQNDIGNVWIRAYGGHNQQNIANQSKTKGNIFVTQIGTGLVTLGEEDQYNLGVMGGFATYSGKAHSSYIDTKMKMKGYSLGLYGTWYAHPVEKRGAYIDSWVLWNKFNNENRTPNQEIVKYDASGITASIEAGGDYLLNQHGKKNWWIQPQAQLIYQGVHVDSSIYNIPNIVEVDHGQDNLQARMGVKTYLNIPSDSTKPINYRPYIALNFIHNTNPYSILMNNNTYINEGSKNLGEFKLGVEVQATLSNQVWLNASYVTGSHNNQAYQGNIGWKYNF